MTVNLQESGNGQRWDVAEDGTGHLYFYTADGDSVWELPRREDSSLAGDRSTDTVVTNITEHSTKPLKSKQQKKFSISPIQSGKNDQTGHQTGS